MFTFPEAAVREPLIYNLGQQFRIVTNIQQAEISEAKGWAILELEGEEEDLEKGIAWITSRGVRVNILTE